MKITNYQIQKNEQRVSVFVDDKYAFSVTKDNFVLNNLYIGKELTEQQILEIQKEDEKSKAFSYVLYQLGFGAKTQKELILKMQKQKYSEEAQYYALNKAKEYGYVDDEEYCESFINQHKNISGWGEQKIYSALITKGISKEIIKRKLEKLYSDDDLFENAYNCALKKYNTIKNKTEDKYKIRQKLYMFLSGRGFNYDVISRVINEICEQEDD